MNESSPNYLSLTRRGNNIFFQAEQQLYSFSLISQVIHAMRWLLAGFVGIESCLYRGGEGFYEG
ncbi:hypothetical protein NC651_020235 [Populus alba x Populus x berolinensis]|nr:hypothetical protein NC651_020235 [Populus alba x Populus x berolinensis]